MSSTRTYHSPEYGMWMSRRLGNLGDDDDAIQSHQQGRRRSRSGLSRLLCL
jgi:hypothetical protein